MIAKLRMTVLAENLAGARGVRAEHGLACWVQADATNILFDTGQGLVLNSNAEVLGVDLTTADAVVLSHGHYDHTGGLESLFGKIDRAKLYVHPRAFEEKYVRHPAEGGRPVGAPLAAVDTIAAHVAGIVWTEKPTELAKGVWVTGQIPRRHDFEDTGGPFFLDEACTEPDPLWDDQALFVETARGVVVLMGCGHSGLVNTLDYVSDLTGGSRIHAVVGGFHLVGASDEKVARVLDALQRHDVQRIGPAHCTALQATAKILAANPDRFVSVAAGSVLTFA